MPQDKTLKRFVKGGCDSDSAPEDVAFHDCLERVNARNTGSGGQSSGYDDSIESNELLAGALLAGFNGGLGGASLEDISKAVCFRYNSAGKNQILLYDNASNTYTAIYTDLTDSAGIPLLPLTPDMWVNCILVNKKYLVWWAKDLEVGYTNLNTLAAGGYGTVLAEDLSLLKPQCFTPITGTYGSDDGQPANYLYGRLPQFIAQYTNTDFNYSAWSTRSKRIVPYQQNTPVAGSDVSQNNYIVVSVNMGSIRVDNVNIAVQFEDSGVFGTIKTVSRSVAVALPFTHVDVNSEVYEAYDPGTNLYSFAFYNNEVAIPVTPTETDLFYDYIWPSNAGEKVNGNIIALGDFKTLYDRPTTVPVLAAVGYNPNIDIPAGTYPDPLRATGSYPGASGSGAGGHKRIMSISLGGTPHTGDKVVLILVDIRSSVTKQDYTYTVPSGLDGNLVGVVAAITETLPRSNYAANGDGTYTINFIGDPYFTMQTYAIELFFGGAAVSNSIATEIDNTVYQLALGYRDGKARPLPLATGASYVVKTPSYAQVNWQAIQISWTLPSAAPAGAVDYQWLTTKPPVSKLLDTTAVLLNYKGTWDASTNMPALAVNTGTVGDTYQITVPASPAFPLTYHDLGNSASYPTGDYVVYNGQSWDVLSKDFGDLTSTGNIVAFSLNPLNLFNSQYATQGVSTILAYDFAVGDRCTLHWYIPNAITAYTITGGSGYTDGIYVDIPLTGGTGHGARASVTVSGGIVTNVFITNAGSGFTVGNTLTGTVPAGTGWSIAITAINANKTFINNPCVNLSVFGYDAGHYIVKVEKSATFDASVLAGTNTFLRLYSPQPQITNIEETAWYEIGERFTITNGVHDTLSGNLTDGGGYYKTRQFPDAVLPYTNPPVNVLATDLNYSDFYPSAYWSKGRVRTFYDELENAEQQASIITSQNYIDGSRVNGLNRFYPANIYGEGDGQTSSSHGAIQIMWMRGSTLVVIQAGNVFYIPVNEAYQVLNPQLTGIAISEKLLNNGRYSPDNIGIGTAKESFWKRFSTGGFISPLISEPVEIGLDGVISISGKKSQYFKSTIQAASAMGKRLVQYYDTFYEEVVFATQSAAGIIRLFPFGDDWNTLDSYTIVPGNVSATPNGAHSTASYNSGTGVVTYTPTLNYVGNDSASFTFNPGSGSITKNNCLTWIAGVSTVNQFVFTDVTGVALATLIVSNTISITGNNVPVAISITGGEYSINGGAYTASAGLVNPNDTVSVRVTSSGSTGTPTSATLTVGATSDTFTATTRVPGNFTVSAAYGMTIESLTNSTSTGVPAGLAVISVPPGSNLSIAYTAVTAGNMVLTVSGVPAIPGHIRANCYVAGVSQGTVLLSGNGSYGLPISAATDPTVILVAIESF